MGYFGKSAKDLTLPEAALLAGIPACPSAYDPINNPEAAIERRNEVLRLMRTRDTRRGRRRRQEAAGVALPGERGRRPPSMHRHGVLPLDAGAAEHRAAALPGAGAALGVRLHPAAARTRCTAQRRCTAAACASRRRSTSTCRTKAQEALETWISEFEDSSRRAQRRARRDGPAHVGDPRRTSARATTSATTSTGRATTTPAPLNSPGSTLKPFTYAAAFEQPGLGPRARRSSTRRSASRTGRQDLHAAQPQRRLPRADQRAQRARQLAEHPGVQGGAVRRRPTTSSPSTRSSA